MANTGYSDRINHALAFAAKHHDQMVRRGTRLPYATHPANVAIILTRYGCDDAAVVAGVLFNVVSDYVADGYNREKLSQRVGEKFGEECLEAALCVAEQRFDTDGVEMSQEERKDDVLARLASADERGRWICAADKLHTAGTLLADLRRTEFPDGVWNRQSAGRDHTLKWYRRVHDELQKCGFQAPIMAELGSTIQELEQFPQ